MRKPINLANGNKLVLLNSTSVFCQHENNNKITFYDTQIMASRCQVKFDGGGVLYKNKTSTSWVLIFECKTTD